jgi:hypothetical protein
MVIGSLSLERVHKICASHKDWAARKFRKRASAAAGWRRAIKMLNILVF